MTVKITCKQCKVSMDRLTYMQMKTCENPNCTCPEVVKVRTQAQQVIEKAKATSANAQSVKRNTIPTGYDDTVDQYMVDVPDVMVIDVIVPKEGNNRRKRK